MDHPKEIRSLFIAKLAKKVTIEVDKAFEERGYSEAIFEEWKHEHFRRKTEHPSSNDEHHL